MGTFFLEQILMENRKFDGEYEFEMGDYIENGVYRRWIVHSMSGLFVRSLRWIVDRG